MIFIFSRHALLTMPLFITINIIANYRTAVGQNPTGTTMSFTRIQQVYKVCQELDIMVIEDDAYYYLYYGRPDGRNVPETSMPGLRGLPRSFLSIDTDNRVIRLDSLSKFVAPGMRLGWVTAAPALIEKYLLLQEATTQFPSGVAQSVFTGLVKHWGEDGLDAHVRKTQAHYLRQRDATVDALTACFPNNEVSYALPDCGMFIWLTFNGMKLSPFELFEMFAGTGVIVVPATDFFVPGPDTGTAEEASKSPAVRITFAASSPAQIRTGIERMAEAILKHHGH